MILTDDILKSAFPALSPKTRKMVLASIGPAIQRYEILTPRRLAAFLGQTHHESAGFTAKVENLNYSASGLIKTWPSRFNPANVDYYARNPTRIANRVYGGRLGNGDEASGDGFAHIGRGFLQTTGKANYLALAKHLGKTLADTIAYLETNEGAFISAGFFWHSNGLNALADSWEITKLGGRINGKTPPFGNKERLALCNAALKALS